MNVRLTAICLVSWLFALAADARGLVCDICGQPIEKGYYTMEDHVTGEKKNICPTCHELEARCFICGLPVKDNYEKLADGRYLCARDAAAAVSSDEEAIEIAGSVRDDLDRLFSRFLTIPETNLVVTIGDKFQLEAPFRTPGNQEDCPTIYGHTQTSYLPDGKFIHRVRLLSHLRKSRLMAVCAHEYGHAWMNENVTHKRKDRMNKDTVEGFCELVAYKYMASRHDTLEMQNIRENNYTKGQIDVLIEADRKYGFNAVLEWMKSGEDDTLDLANLDRIRAVGRGYVPTPEAALAALLYVPPQAPTPEPETLRLKGISGTARHPFALINDATFQAGEQWNVRLGQTKVSVQCIEIRSNSVVVLVAGSHVRKELFLPRNP